jgi:hypothetical protein
MSKPLQDIHKLKVVVNVVASPRARSTYLSMVLLTIIRMILVVILFNQMFSTEFNGW